LYELLSVTGNDARHFLQGQLTQDVRRVDAAYALACAWCNPKGRVVATMTLVRLADGLGLLVPANMGERLHSKLSMYKLRADVVLDRVFEWRNSGAIDIDRLRASGVVIPDDECDAPSAKSILIRAGIVTIDADNSEKYTPHMLSLDLAGAVSFDKGCYTGQEIVARTENLGHSRRRLMRYECDSNVPAVADELFDGNHAVGNVVNASGHDVLAVTPTELHGQALTLNGEAARPASLPWL